MPRRTLALLSCAVVASGIAGCGSTEVAGDVVPKTTPELTPPSIELGNAPRPSDDDTGATGASGSTGATGTGGASGSASPSGSTGSGRSVAASSVSHEARVGASTGARQPCCAHALENGVNTL